MRAYFPKYTPEEDARVLACAPKDLPALAQEIGRTTAALQTRRMKLRSDDTSMPIHKQVARHHGSPAPRNFARPDWFDEDLERMSVVKS